MVWQTIQLELRKFSMINSFFYMLCIKLLGKYIQIHQKPNRKHSPMQFPTRFHMTFMLRKEKKKENEIADSMKNASWQQLSKLQQSESILLILFLKDVLSVLPVESCSLNLPFCQVIDWNSDFKSHKGFMLYLFDKVSFTVHEMPSPLETANLPKQGQPPALNSWLIGHIFSLFFLQLIIASSAHTNSLH